MGQIRHQKIKERDDIKSNEDIESKINIMNKEEILDDIFQENKPYY